MSMAKNQNTFEKRRREMEKKRKAEEKRDRRRKKRGPADGDADTSPLSSSDRGAKEW
jgi:hypothetical protein